MIIAGYIIIERKRSGVYTYQKKYTIRLVNGKPSLKPSEIALKLSIQVPDVFWDRVIPAVDIKVPENAILSPDIGSVLTITADEVSQKLNIDFQDVLDGLTESIRKKNEKENTNQ